MCYTDAMTTTRTRARKGLTPSGPAKIVAIDDPKLDKGDPVRITGHPGVWTFHERKRNTDTGAEWITVYGGSTNPLGSRSYRSFAPETVRKIRRRKTA